MQFEVDTTNCSLFDRDLLLLM